jgi:membrane associated rhomboid family serine protease
VPIVSSLRAWRQTVRTLPATHPFNLRFGELAHLAPLIMVSAFTSLFALAFVGGYFLRWTQNAHADFGLATGMGWDWIRINTSWLAHADAAHLKANIFALALAAMGVMALSMTRPPATYPGKDQVRHMLSDLGRCLMSQAVVLLPIAWTCGLLDGFLYPSGSNLVGSSGVIAGLFGLMAVDLCVRRRITDMRWIVATLIVAAFGAKSLERVH